MKRDSTGILWVERDELFGYVDELNRQMLHPDTKNIMIQTSSPGGSIGDFRMASRQNEPPTVCTIREVKATNLIINTRKDET